jgi:hypothetical protein
MVVGKTIRNVVRIDFDDRDYRDVISNQYKLRLVPERPNCLELTVPVCGFSRRDHTQAAAVKAMEARMNRAYPRIQELIDVTRNGLSADQKKVYLIRFPEDMALSNDLFSPSSRNGVVEYTFIPMETGIEYKSRRAGVPTHVFNLTNTHITWMLSTVQAKQLVVETTRDMDAQEKLDAQMAGMNVSAP